MLKVSFWTIAGAGIIATFLAMCAVQFSTLVDIPGWAAAVIAVALVVDVISIAMTPAEWRGKAIINQGKIIGALVFCAIAIGAAQAMSALVGPVVAHRQAVESMPPLVATWVVVFGGSIALAAAAVVEARLRLKDSK
ncbi:hypothetical protein ABIC83_002968 [Roseateles asaccharophilus]|uniref:hypothetical protein n=1 Tax=Roseateles asaccharophilus TaxID=582607 RepID=UPI00383971F0